MSTGKLIALIAAILINCAAVAAFLAWTSNAVARAATQPGHTPVVTLPTINVYPSAAERAAIMDARSRS
ncbi:MAG: hypothetical protein EPN36_02445 [Rhodanobacteraceae bacterium]|nr:MAG: hypothetical protein EPN36_02445 [Rhodanobacteraceae bacterium]